MAASKFLLYCSALRLKTGFRLFRTSAVGVLRYSSANAINSEVTTGLLSVDGCPASANCVLGVSLASRSRLSLRKEANSESSLARSRHSWDECVSANWRYSLH